MKSLHACRHRCRKRATHDQLLPAQRLALEVGAAALLAAGHQPQVDRQSHRGRGPAGVGILEPQDAERVPVEQRAAAADGDA